MEDDASVGGHKEVDDNAQWVAMQAATPIGGDGPTQTWREAARKAPVWGAARRCAWCGVRATRLVRLQRWRQ
jgi:hypothetical protein